MLSSNIELDRNFLCRAIAILGADDVAVAVAAPVAKMTIDVVVIVAMGVAVIVAADAVLFASALPAPVRQKHFHCPEQGSEPEVAAVTSQISVTNVDRASAVAGVDMGFHCPEQGFVAAVTYQIPLTNVDRVSAVAAVDMGLVSAAGMNYIQPPSGAWASGFPLWEEQSVFRRLEWLKRSAVSACLAYFAD